MRVLIFEDNLMWSARLRDSVRSLGHEPVVVDKMTGGLPSGEVAIVNLGSARLPAAELVPRLKSAGVHVVGHAGHKERPLAQLGNDLGCDQVVSNSTITFHLAKVLEMHT
ncbi:MAG: hypothetical protein KF857_08740 [Fimbriimonadaceae bacterium]|nr:hypothetical protein [Fimbriimonadaceae bacterium]